MEFSIIYPIELLRKKLISYLYASSVLLINNFEVFSIKIDLQHVHLCNKAKTFQDKNKNIHFMKISHF